MTSRLLTRKDDLRFGGTPKSAQQRRDGDRFEPVIRVSAAGDLPAQGRALPRLDQKGGQLRGIEIGADVVSLAVPNASRECLVPAVENTNEFGPRGFARSAELERQVSDQAAEQEIAGLVFVGERVEEARDA